MLLNIIRIEAPISRKEVSHISQLSIATTKRLIEELLSENLVVEIGVNDNPRGRKASLLQLNGDYGGAIGVNIIPHVLEIVGISFTGRIIYKNMVQGIHPDCQTILPCLKREVGKACAFINSEYRGKLLGIGVGIAGLVDIQKGLVHYTPNIEGWENVPLGSILSEEFHTDVIVDDSVRCMALSEKRYGAGRNLSNFLYIYIGQGVGAGIILDGRMYRGDHGIAGEFGHITIRKDGNLCNCGNRGCLEAHVSVTPIIEEVKKNILSNVYTSLKQIYERAGTITLRNILEESLKGDKLANLIINSVSEDVGVGIANLVNVFDPGVIILGGEVVDTFGEAVMDNVKRVVSLKAINAISSRTSIMRCGINEFIAPRGAATLLIEKYLGNSILNM